MQVSKCSGQMTKTTEEKHTSAKENIETKTTKGYNAENKSNSKAAFI